MPAHEFEKSVQQRMEDLRVAPSDAVWNRVEMEINRNKRRRRFLLVLPLLVLIGLGIYWGTQQSDDPAVEQSAKIEKTYSNDTKSSVADPVIADMPSPGTPKQDNSKSGDITPAPVADPGKPNADLANLPDALATEQIRQSPIQSAHQTTPEKAGFNKSVSSGKLKHAKNAIEVVSPVSAREELSQPQGSSVPPVVVSDEEDFVQPYLGVKAVQSYKSAVVNFDSVQYESDERLPQSLTPMAKSHIVKPNVAAKWHWGIVANGSASKLVDGTLLGAFEKSLPMSSRQYSMADANGRPGPLGIPSLPAKAADVNPGISAGIGFFVKREFKGRVSVTGGLQYNYYSTRTKIGSRIDSPTIVNNSFNYLRVAGYYANSGNNSYTNKYHFIELPVSMDIRLTNKTALPVSLSTGLSLGYMFGTNALHYDTNSGVYFKDNSLFNRLQVGLNAGVNMMLFASRKYKLELGPQFSYKLGSLLKQNDKPSVHLMSAGLMLKWYMR